MTDVPDVLRRWARHWMSRPRQRGKRRVAFTLIAMGGVLLIGLLDVSTGADLTLGVFYLLPVALATVTCGGSTGVGLVGMCAGVGLAADIWRRERFLSTHLVNAGLRGLILLIVVALIVGLRSALERAQRSEQHSREFLTIAAHQLRTPIASVQTAVDLLIIQGVPASQEQTLKRIATETARGGRLVASLLRIARLDQGEVGVIGDCSVRDLVGAGVDRLRGQAPALSVRSFVEPAVPSVAQLSPDATQEALDNLLDNARKHAKEFVGIEVSAANDELRIRVYDDGPGVKDGDTERIFERFVTLDGRGGSGLGLPIARGLIERQGGQLTYTGGGFVITLPLAANA